MICALIFIFQPLLLSDRQAMADPPGFRRVEKHGERVHYLGLPQEVGEAPRKLFMMTEVDNYLKTNQKRGRLLDIRPTDFDFRKRLPKRQLEETGEERQAKRSEVFSEMEASQQEGPAQEIPVDEKQAKFRFNVENLLHAGVKLDHKTVLEDAAGLLDTFRLRCDEPEFNPAKLAELKLRLANEETLQVSLTGIVAYKSF